ncbi:MULTISPECIES: amidohydrolase family protein [Pseudoalteromonas]|uniref:amidohydrolase family protein n=1 Tax=Pseudoalteromonas TaxID=53246 RepID=UPI00123041E2|nr:MULTISPECIES: amidohydrolase family protein [Pseudoalteromonas]MBB1479862.1 amidohydrolase family protein [Pseudoalteromonas sp. SG41-2]
MSERIIDPHVHFFNLVQGQYDWLQGNNPVPWPNLDTIKAPISVNQLQHISQFEIAGLVHIEAGFDNQHPINELHWLAEHLGGHNYKAISFANINSHPDDFNNAITALSHPSLVGIRDITEGADAMRLSHATCHDNLALLASKQLIFEAQFEVEKLTITQQLINYCQQLPHLQLIINHAGLPNNLSIWQQGISQLAQLPNCWIKFSGFELLTAQLQTQQQQCFNFILQHFGQHRVMFASNFPVCQINASYQQRWSNHFELCNTHSVWQQLSYKNAQHCYQV